MIPVEGSKKVNERLLLYGDYIGLSKKRAKFKVGDRVSISKYKAAVFDKAHTPSWSEEILVLRTVVYTNPT